jgi:hypothetical protein
MREFERERERERGKVERGKTIGAARVCLVLYLNFIFDCPPKFSSGRC